MHMGVRFGPGNLLFERLLEREFEAGTVTEVNCMTDMPWHRNWGLPRSAYARIVLFPRRPVPLLTGWVPARLKARARQTPWIRELIRRGRGNGSGPV